MAVEGTETCDDGNTEQGDRCSPTCQAEHPETCPGTPITIDPGSKVVISDDTSTGIDTFTDSSGIDNCKADSYPGKDLVYAVTPTAAGVLSVTLSATYVNSYIHVRTACPGSQNEEVACKYRSTAGDVVQSFSVSAGTTYYVVPDSWKSAAGKFTLTLTLN